jgi:hypothetical protein
MYVNDPEKGLTFQVPFSRDGAAFPPSPELVDLATQDPMAAGFLRRDPQTKKIGPNPQVQQIIDARKAAVPQTNIPPAAGPPVPNLTGPVIPENRIEPMLSENQTGQTRANELRQKYGQPGIFDNYESFQPKPRAASFFDSFDYNQRLEKEKGRQATGIANFFSGASIPENQKMPLTMGLLSFGAQLLADSGNNNMFLAQGIGRGLQAGIGGYNAAMTSQQKAAQFQAEKQMEQQRLQMQQARDNVNANYINAQIGQINLQQQNQQNSIDLGKRLRLQLPNLVKSNTISSQEYDIFSNMSDLQIGKELPALIQQGPEREAARINLELTRQDMDAYNRVPDVKKALRESGSYSDQQLAILEPLNGKRFYDQLGKIKPLSLPTNLTKGNALGYVMGLQSAGKLDPNNPEHKAVVAIADPLYVTEKYEDQDGNISLVQVPNRNLNPAFNAFRTDVEFDQSGIPVKKGRPNTEETKAAEQTASMIQTHHRLDELYKTGYRPGYNVAQQILSTGGVFNMRQLRQNFNNANDRLFVSLAYQFADSYARARTGAAMRDEEFANYYMQFFVNKPITGDVATSEFQDYRKFRLDAVERMINKSGRGWNILYGDDPKFNKPFIDPFGSGGGSETGGGGPKTGGSVYDEEDRKLGGA